MDVEELEILRATWLLMMAAASRSCGSCWFLFALFVTTIYNIYMCIYNLYIYMYILYTHISVAAVHCGIVTVGSFCSHVVMDYHRLLFPSFSSLLLSCLVH